MVCRVGYKVAGRVGVGRAAAAGWGGLGRMGGVGWPGGGGPGGVTGAGTNVHTARKGVKMAE